MKNVSEFFARLVKSAHSAAVSLWGAVKSARKEVRILLAAVSFLLAAAIVVIIVLLASRGESSEKLPESTDPVWPEVALTEGLPVPEMGKITGVSADEDIVSVFFEGVSNEELKAYMAKTGLSFSGEMPYLAYGDGWMIILTRNGEGALSLVLTKTEK